MRAVSKSGGLLLLVAARLGKFEAAPVARPQEVRKATSTYFKKTSTVSANFLCCWNRKAWPPS
jgi:hypothetical protein